MQSRLCRRPCQSFCKIHRRVQTPAAAERDHGGPAAREQRAGSIPRRFDVDGIDPGQELVGRLRRGAEKELGACFDLSVSMLGVMGRLVPAERRTLRQTVLADAMGLSLSRVSRIIDVLEQRKLVTRTPCPVDGRATNVTLTAAGLKVTRAAQDTLFAFVESAFFDGLSEDEIETLVAVFRRLLGPSRGQEARGSG